MEPAKVIRLWRLLPRSLILVAAGLALIVCMLGRASEADASRPLVIFFGGYGASSVDMAAWKAAAEASSPYGRSFDFEAISYPINVSSDERTAILAGRETIDAVVTKIAATADREVILAGHSSGAALAVSVVEKSAGRRNIRLLILDDGVDIGFVPPVGFDSDTQVECWSAKDDGLRSINQRKTMKFCKKYHEMKITGCRTRACLHFRLVNYNASTDLNLTRAVMPMPNGSSAGYANLRINLDWLAPIATAKGGD
jgi:pimeloyl-ACP methyl ester carboxylesterase